MSVDSLLFAAAAYVLEHAVAQVALLLVLLLIAYLVIHDHRQRVCHAAEKAGKRAELAAHVRR